MNGKEVDLTGENVTIKSTNFNVDEDGNIVISAEEENEEGKKVSFTIKKDTQTYIEFYAAVIRAFKNGYETLRIDSNNPLIMLRNSQTLGGTAIWADYINLQGIAHETKIRSSGIETPILTQTSLLAKKENIKELNANALELIRNSNICLYNFKGEKEESKQHLGLIIGEGYNCPQEVISENGQGIEQYSMTSLAWKAIQELIEENKKLNKRLEKLEEEDNND